jgi:hypothetical protein
MLQQDGLDVRRSDSTRMRRRFAQTFVNISQAYRDLIIDFSITLFNPKDVLVLRNLIQGVIRTFLGLTNETRLFDISGDNASLSKGVRTISDEVVLDITEKPPPVERAEEKEILRFVAHNLSEPTGHLLACMKIALQSCDAVLMEMCGHRQYLGPSDDVSNDVAGALVALRKSILAFSDCQDSVLASERLPPAYADFPEVVQQFAFCRLVHQSATAVEALLVKVNQMEQNKPKYPKFFPPSYPFWKSLHRTNAPVRHDRGGVTAGQSSICSATLQRY